ncbi:hypothetical protein TSUD_202890 [Trifolium subterraneum]|uniref:RanBP2-type domain-containing protein n=1 Tax=Trifolium subterraneum TaxID=3900 RepID=A0A2Z6M0G5_TRISU|nr:hypothetical protein TSUD_202890 [Trifolium subterraneum]
MSSWSCDKCTFINPPQISECEMCKSSPPPPSSASTSTSSPPPPSPKWSCKSCTLFNSYKTSTCHLCGTRSSVLSNSTLTDILNIDDDHHHHHSKDKPPVFYPLRRCKRKAVDSPEHDSANDSDNPVDLTTEKVDSGKDFGSFKILSYNVWFREDLELHKRMKAIGFIITTYMYNPRSTYTSDRRHVPVSEPTHEVTPDIYDIFKRSTWWNVYHCSVSSEKAHSRPYFCMQLSKLPVKSFSTKAFSNSIMGRELCIAELEDVSGKSLVVATSHLESPCPGPPTWDQMFSKERVEQANEALNLLKRYPNVVFGGDMNWDEKKDGQYPLLDGWVDAWSELRPNETGWTYDTKSNQMLTGNRKLQIRLDRFVCHLRDLKISSIDMIGMDEIHGVSYIKEKKVRTEIKQLVLPVLPSDHYGLLLTISSK